MASYHLSVKTIKRSAGRSATAAAAYRSGGIIACDREGRVHDYSAKRGIEACFILAPEGAPDWVRDRAALWNAAEARETRKNSVTAREWELALPAELGAEDRAGLVRDFGQALVARYGIAVDVALHAPHREGDQRNHHAHVLTTTRAIGAEGFGDKTRILDAAKTGGVEIEAMRGLWAELQNRALERTGQETRVDHRSLEAQRDAAEARGDAFAAEALDRAPEVKLGPAANAMERRAQREAEMNGSVYRPVTERGRAVQALRQAREALRQMRERVGQVQAVYAQARDKGQDRVSAGLAALRAAAARDGGGSLTERLVALLQDRRARDGGRMDRRPAPSVQARDGAPGREPDRERAPASRPRDEQLLQALVQIANTAARGAQPRFTDAKAADAFFRDLRTSYGQDILTRISQGDDRALAGDFPKAEDRQQVARAITGIARAHGLEQDRRAAERENGRPAKDRETDWER